MIISAHSTVITQCYVGRAGGEVTDWFWSGAPRTWSLSAGVGGEVDTSASAGTPHAVIFLKPSNTTRPAPPLVCGRTCCCCSRWCNGPRPG